MPKITVEAQVDGGKASPGPLGPSLGPLGVNIPQIIAKINEKTKDFAGMKVPVKVIIDDETKDFEVTVGTPPATSLIKKELGIDKGSGSAAKEKVADLTMEQAKKIARMKGDSLLSFEIKHSVKEVIGTCVSMGITVEGKDPRDIQKEIDDGKWDSHFSD